MNITEMITSQLMNQSVTEDLSKKIEAKPDQVEQALSMILPTLLSGMSQNIESEKGLEGLMGALQEHKGSTLGSINQVDTKEGAKILSHLLGNKTSTVSKNVAKSSGLNTKQTDTLMASIAPLLMVTLGKQNLDPKTMVKLMKGFTGNKSMMKMGMKLLDANNDGNIFDDLGKLAKGFFKK